MSQRRMEDRSLRDDPIIAGLRIARMKTMSVYQLSVKTGFAVRTIQEWEDGNWSVSLAKLRVWAEALGYDIVLRKLDDENEGKPMT